ncbi:MAG: WD40 repeat domain-containing protein [Actinobacteria bacterium]|nr:WD40 repeat domain-containing protein [Actinomycetota bacterium]
MKKLQALVLGIALALVATACGQSQETAVYVEEDTERNAALATDDGQPFFGISCCVKDIAKDSQGNFWIGGDFNTIGRVTGGATQVFLGSTEKVLPRVSGIVYKVLSDGNNGYYLAGLIGAVGTARTASIVHVGADGNLDRSFAAAIPAGIPVIDLAVGTDNNNARVLYAAVPNGILKVDATTGASLGTLALTFRGFEAVPQVVKLESVSRGLVVTGSFLVARAVITGAIVVNKDGSHAASVSLFNRDANGTTNWGEAIAIDSYKTSLGADAIYIGGDFNSSLVWTAANGAAVEPEAVGNATRLLWENAGVKVVPTAKFEGGTVNAISVGATGFVSTVYFGGNFTRAVASNTLDVQRLAALVENLASGARTIEAAGSANSTVSTLLYSKNGSSDTLFVAGDFTTLNGAPHYGLAFMAKRVSGWGVVTVIRFIKTDGVINSAAVGSSGLVVGGNFNVAGYPIGTLLRTDPDGRILPQSIPNPPNGPVNALAVDNGMVYVGGKFDSVGGNLVTSFVRYLESGEYDPRMQVRLTQDFDVAEVKDIVFNGDKLYVGGSFTGFNGVGNRNFITVDSRRFISLAGRQWESTNGPVRSIAVSPDGSKVAVAGDFTTMSVVGRNGLAVIDETAGAITDFLTGAARGSRVNSVAFAPSGDSLYLAYEAGDSPLVHQGLNRQVIKRFPDIGGKIEVLSVGGGKVYAGLSDRQLRVVDISTNTVLSGFSGFPLGTTALVADADGAWMAGRGFKIGENPVYGPVRISADGKIEVSPSAEANARLIASQVNETVSSVPAEPEVVNTTPVADSPVFATGDVAVAPLPIIETLVSAATSAGSGRVSDAAGNVYGYRIAADGTISLDRADIERSTSRSLMVTKLKPGNKSMTVTFVAPAGIKNVKIRAYPSGKSLTCSPGKKTACTIKNLNPQFSYRFTVEGMLGKKKAVSPRSFATKPVVTVRRGSTVSLTTIVGKASGSTKYSVTGGCTLESKNKRVKAPKNNAYCVVSAGSNISGAITGRSVIVKVG